jgi:acetylornithine deacetylase/succinyl-diaminopimelate desuccinylase-like protein
VTQDNVVATLPVERPEQRLILSAHYDTKTELLDHIARTPLQLLAIPMFGLLVAAPLRGVFRKLRGEPPGRWERVGGTAAAIYGAAIGLTYAAGAFLPARSPGALDDGAACAVLVRAAERIAAEITPERTEVQIVLFSAEELGAHGAWSWVGARFADGTDLPTAAVNLELVGGSRRFLAGGEMSLARQHRPPDALLDAIDRALAAAGGAPLHRTRGSGLTDAVAFLAHGIPAVTVVGREGRFLLPRGMHSARDARRRIDPAAMDLTLRTVLELVVQADRDGLPGVLPTARAPASSP